jgi:hypothetical protein
MYKDFTACRHCAAKGNSRFRQKTPPDSPFFAAGSNRVKAARGIESTIFIA